jgi:hypothetical protein
MKFIQHLLSNKRARNLFAIAFVVLVLISNLISYQPKPKLTRQIGSSSDDVQVLWTRKMYLWNHVADWETNAIYVRDPKTGKLLAIDGLTGETVWSTEVPFGARDLLIGDQAVFAVTSYVSAFRASTGKLLWTTKLDDAHASIYAQEEDSLLRVYYGKKIFEVSQKSGEIISVQPKENIVWIQNNVEIHCPLTPSQDGAVEHCWVGLTGVDRATGQILWKNNKPIFSEYYQELSDNNVVYVEFPGDGICPLSPNTGEYAWCLPEGKISNIATDNDGTTGYFIRHDFSLVKIDLLTGGILAETQFLPMVLPEEMERDNYGYRVAVTKDTVIVSFGDSDQTFGLRFNP